MEVLISTVINKAMWFLLNAFKVSLLQAKLTVMLYLVRELNLAITLDRTLDNLQLNFTLLLEARLAFSCSDLINQGSNNLVNISTDYFPLKMYSFSPSFILNIY